MQILPDAVFRSIVANTNLFAIDLIIRNLKGEILLGLRTNPPAKGFWFVPGGRVYKNEHLKDAFNRLLTKETGIAPESVRDIRLKGFYEHIYEDNVFGAPSFNTHYIMAACEMELVGELSVTADAQHEMMKFASVEDILRSDDVHQFVKNYFVNSPPNGFP